MNYDSQPSQPNIRLSLIKFVGLFCVACSFNTAHAQADEIAIDKNGIKVWKVKVPNSENLGFKAKADVKGNINDILEIIKDFGNSDEWVPRTKDAKVISYNDKTKKGIYYCVLDMPFPISDREMLISGEYKFHKNGNITVINKGISLKSHPPKKGMIRIKEYHSNFLLEKKGENLTSVTLKGHADPAGNLPAMVVNLFVTQQPYDMMTNLRKEVKKVSKKR